MAKIQTNAILGIDAGGSFTRYAVYDLEGKLLEHHVSDSLHFMKVGFDGIEKALRNMSHVLDYNFVTLVIGMAGYGKDPQVRKSIEEAVYPVFPNASLMSDAEMAMISALEYQEGIYCISGTGSIAFMGQERRGGFGYLIGDEGSAFWIGKKIIEVFSKEADGRLEKTEVYSSVMEYFKMEDPYQLISILNKGPYRELLAGLAKVCSTIDSVEYIYEAAGKELAGLVNGFKCKEGTQVALGGSVLLHNERVRQSFISNLEAQYRIKETNHSVEYAAVIINKKKLNP